VYFKRLCKSPLKFYTGGGKTHYIIHHVMTHLQKKLCPIIGLNELTLKVSLYNCPGKGGHKFKDQELLIKTILRQEKTVYLLLTLR